MAFSSEGGGTLVLVKLCNPELFQSRTAAPNMGRQLLTVLKHISHYLSIYLSPIIYLYVYLSSEPANVIA